MIALPLALTPGTRLGPYEIAAAIGAGGMGEVYRAKDTKLHRDVAIKVLPESFATKIGGSVDKAQYAVARDGRFLINQAREGTTVAPITLIQHWNPEAKK